MTVYLRLFSFVVLSVLMGAAVAYANNFPINYGLKVPSLLLDLQSFFSGDDLAESQGVDFFLNLSMLAIVLVVVMILLLARVNRRLHSAVAIKTADYLATKDRMNRYLEIVNRYTCTTIVDQDLNFVYLSDAFCQLIGYDEQELLGQPQSQILHPDFDLNIVTEMLTVIKQGKSWHGEVMQLSKFGEKLYLDVHIEPKFTLAGKFDGYTSVRMDITDKKQIERSAMTDALTKLYNRSKLDTLLLTEIKRSSRGDGQLSVVMMDVDFFKLVNDKHGHLEGDKVLLAVADIIKARIRDSDYAGRWGGEEFLVICSESDLQGALLLAENLRQNVSRYIFGVPDSLTASFGVAQYDGSEDAKQLIERADQALYEAKSRGRNCVIASDTASSDSA